MFAMEVHCASAKTIRPMFAREVKPAQALEVTASLCLCACIIEV
jgi:hypothetical protein